MAGVDKEKRGLHDFLCDTRVIYAKKIKVIPVYPRYQAPPVRPAGPGAPGNPPQPPLIFAPDSPPRPPQELLLESVAFCPFEPALPLCNSLPPPYEILMLALPPSPPRPWVTFVVVALPLLPLLPLFRL